MHPLSSFIGCVQCENRKKYSIFLIPYTRLFFGIFRFEEEISGAPPPPPPPPPGTAGKASTSSTLKNASDKTTDSDSKDRPSFSALRMFLCLIYIALYNYYVYLLFESRKHI